MRLQTRRHAKTCQHCKRPFSGTLSAKFCSESCRKAAYYRRNNPIAQRARRDKQPAKRAALATCCAFCGSSFWANSPLQKFCSTSCRTMNHRNMRHEAIRTFAALHNVPVSQVEDIADKTKITHVRKVLEAAGYCFDTTARTWLNLNNVSVSSQMATVR
jgi:hypothetical protein